MKYSFTLPDAATQWLARLQPQERRALMALAVFLAAIVLWFGVWAPLKNLRDAKEATYQSLLQDVRWMEAQAAQGSGVVAPADAKSMPEGSSILSLATAAAQGHHITLSRAEPAEDNRLHVTLESAPFSKVLTWLQELQGNYGIRAINVTLERKTGMPGYVSATLVLEH